MKNQHSHYKVKLASKIQAFNVDEIIGMLECSNYRVQQVVRKSPTFKMLADFRKRFDESEANTQDDGWTFIAVDSEEDSAAKKLMLLFPQLLEKQILTDEEVQKMVY